MKVERKILEGKWSEGKRQKEQANHHQLPPYRKLDTPEVVSTLGSVLLPLWSVLEFWHQNTPTSPLHDSSLPFLLSPAVLVGAITGRNSNVSIIT